MKINSNSFNNVSSINQKGKIISKASEDSSKVNAKSDQEEDCSVSISQESESYREYVSRMDDLLNKIGNGEAVSEKDRNWLEGEVQSMLSGHYDNLGSFSFQRADVLEDLKKDVAEKNKKFNEMLQQNAADSMKTDFSFIQTTKELELKEKEELIEKFSKSMEDEDNVNKKDEKNHMYDEQYFTDTFVEKYIDKEFDKLEKDIDKDIIKGAKAIEEE